MLCDGSKILPEVEEALPPLVVILLSILQALTHDINFSARESALEEGIDRLKGVAPTKDYKPMRAYVPSLGYARIILPSIPKGNIGSHGQTQDFHCPLSSMRRCEVAMVRRLVGCG